MIDWLVRLFGGPRARKEKNAVKAEARVDRLEDQAVKQEERLSDATNRVSRAIRQVERVEKLAKERRG